MSTGGESLAVDFLRGALTPRDSTTSASSSSSFRFFARVGGLVRSWRRAWTCRSSSVLDIDDKSFSKSLCSGCEAKEEGVDAVGIGGRVG